MEKNKFIRTYLWLSIFLVIMIMIINVIYLGEYPVSETLFPSGFNGLVEKDLFNVTLTNYNGELTIFNWPLVIHAAFLLISVLNLVLVFKGEPLKKKLISEVMVYNVLIAFMLVVSSALFIFFIPDAINGVIDNGFIMTKFPRQANELVNAYNLSFVLLTVYAVLNFTILTMTKEKKVVKKEEFNEGELFL
jgi:hypothetical protein